MKVVKGAFEDKKDKKEKKTARQKIMKALDSMPYLDGVEEYDFSLVVSDPQGYTTVATNVCIADTVLMLESCKLALILNMSGDDTDEVMH